mmetsp:Transcript_91766/g.186837  ORF Transcript_91766/g.186837 Transcript_91766/m.186837 type:complete len:645 (+) Transcript_91766:3-1937(+)
MLSIGAKEQLRSLGQEVLTQKGRVASTTAEIQELTEDARENEESQQSATEIRQKEHSEHAAETAELQQALAATEQAVVVLRDATASPAALVQSHGQGQGLRGQSAVAFLEEEVARRVEAVAAAAATPGASAPASHLALLRQYAVEVAQQKGKGTYAPQSATIQGILQEMYGTFSTDLETRTTDEAGRNRAYEDFMAEKQAALVLIQESLQKKTAEKTEAEVMLAEAAQAYDDTQEQLKADVAFFDATKASCQAKSSEWQERKSLRVEELNGITQALDILTSDDARALFGKTIKPGFGTFLQVAQDTIGPAAQPARKAYQALKEQATASHSLRLARLAAEVRVAKVGHFDKVIEAIDKMFLTLKEEESADIAKRDQCKEEYHKITKTIADLEWKEEVSQAKIDKLISLLDTKEKERLATVAEMGVVEQQRKDMKKRREDENQAFLNGKAEDEEAVRLLTSAKEVLASYYVQNNVSMGSLQGSVKGLDLLQAEPEFQVSPEDAPEAEFSGKGHRKYESKGILSLLANIIEDLEGEVASAQRAEAKAQLAWEAEDKAAKASLDALEAHRVDLVVTLARLAEEKTQELKTLDGIKTDIQGEVDYRKSIKPDCDWIIGAFDERRTKRRAEMDGLTQAKEFLAGFQAQKD